MHQSALLSSRCLHQKLFYIGGILPLGLSIVLIRALPDSIEFLVMRGAARRDIRDLVIRICPTVDIASGCQFLINDERTRGVAVSQLFSAGRAWGTILLWASYFISFLMLVTSGAWTPTLLQRAGINGAQSSVAIALFALGSVFGTPLAGFLASRFAARRVLPAALVGSAVARRLKRSEFSHHVPSALKMGANHRALRGACQLFSRAFRVLEARSRTAPRRLF